MLNILMALIGIILLILLVIILIVLGVNAHITKLSQDQYTSEERFASMHKIASRIITFVLNIKVDVTGLEKLEGVQTGAIFPNHQSNMDIAALLKVIDRPHGYVAKKELDNIFLLSNGMRLIKCQFLDRNDVRQSVKVISATVKTVKEGHLMVVFPEGTRKIGGEMGLFKPGSFKIAQKAKADIIPVTIFNSYEVAKRWPRQTVVKVEIHDPIKYEAYEELTTTEISEKVETIVKSKLNK